MACQPGSEPATSDFGASAQQQPDSTPGVGGELAIGSGAVLRKRPRWGPEYATQDIEEFRYYPEWWDLIEWVKHSLIVSSQEALSAHTTEAIGPSGSSESSLKSCGWEEILSAYAEVGVGCGQLAGGGRPAVGGIMYLRIDLPNAFVNGDGLGIRYVSEFSKSKKQVQFQSCLELLCYLTVSVPARVRVCPKCFSGGTDRVDEFKNKAV